MLTNKMNMMKKATTIIALILICFMSFSQSIYIDYNKGFDSNTGTLDHPLKTIAGALNRIDTTSTEPVKLVMLPGIYYIDETIHIKLKTENLNNRQLTIEALYLPDDEKWEPELMPIILTTAKPDTSFGSIYSSVGLMIDMNHVTIKGIKFTGNPYPHIPCYPIARENIELHDLVVSQCMFVGNTDASYIQVGVIAHGDLTAIRNCVFYGCGNAVVFWLANKEKKFGNEIANSIVYNCDNGVWTSDADSAFVFQNNIISNCKFPFIKNYYNQSIYTFTNSVIAGNENYIAEWTNDGIVPGNYEIIEDNMMKEGAVDLVFAKRGSGKLEKRYLHPKDQSLGCSIGAGLFLNDKR